MSYWKSSGRIITSGNHVFKVMDNTQDVWRIADDLDESFETIKKFNRVEDISNVDDALALQSGVRGYEW